MKFDHLPASMRRPGDVPWRSPKGSDVQDLQETLKGLLGDQQKNWWFHQKRCFLDATFFVLHIYYFFYWKNKYLKVLYGDVNWTSMGPSCGMFRGLNNGTFWGRPRDVRHICFLNSTQKHIKLTFIDYSTLYSELL